MQTIFSSTCLLNPSHANAPPRSVKQPGIWNVSLAWRSLQPYLRCRDLRVQSTDAECLRLREENACLRQLLMEHNIPVRPTEPVMRPCTKLIEVSSLEAKRARKRIALIRSLFRGREDVLLDDGKAQTDERDTHLQHRTIGGQLTGANRKIERKSIKERYPELQLSNNLAENSMRPVAVGRRTGFTLAARKPGRRSRRFSPW